MELRELCDHWKVLRVHNKLLHYRNADDKLRVYVPTSVRKEVLTTAHSSAPELPSKMLNALRLRLRRPNVRHNNESFVGDCDSCVRNRVSILTRKVPLRIFTASPRFEVAYMGILGGDSACPGHPEEMGIFWLLLIFLQICGFGSFSTSKGGRWCRRSSSCGCCDADARARPCEPMADDERMLLGCCARNDMFQSRAQWHIIHSLMVLWSG